MLNHICIMGRLTRDPELRRTNSGKPVSGFTVAVDRDYAPEGQERETDFIDCIAWNGTAEFVDNYFRKGSMIVVKGRLQIRGWTDKDGNKRRSAEVVSDDVYFGESRKSQDSNNATCGQNSYQRGNYAPSENQNPQNYGGYPNQYVQSQPQYYQQGFDGYQASGYSAPGYQPTPAGFHMIDGDDPNLPF